MTGKRFSLEHIHNSPGTVELSSSESRHLAARRVKIDETIELIDAGGNCWDARVRSVKPYSVELLGRLAKPESSGLTLVVAIPQANRAPILVEKCTEIGVGRIQPIICDRSVAVPKSSDNFVERWTRIAMSAVEQSGAVLPGISRPLPFATAIRDCPNPVLLDPSADTGLDSFIANMDGREISVFIGPEGGFSTGEIEIAEKNGASFARLGSTILRVETAAIAAAVIYNMSTPTPGNG